jgi:myosin heavy subunit
VAEDLKALTRIATLSGHPPSTSLPALLKTSQTIISNSTQHLSQLRLDLTTQTLTTQNLHRTLLEAAIRILEQTVHGSLSRGTKAKADYLATVAEGMARKLQVQEVQLAAQTTSPEYQAALERKAESLEREAMGLRRRVREAEELLGRYRRTEGMEEVAREYVEIVREREKVRADIERLEAGK